MIFGGEDFFGMKLFGARKIIQQDDANRCRLGRAKEVYRKSMGK
jgi:hypothetical protein